MAKTLPSMKALTVAATLCLSLQCLPAAAQWMWRGADGRVNASDRPPPSGVAEKDIIKKPQADNRQRPPAASAASAPALEASAAAGAASAPARVASAPAAPLEREVQARKQAAERDKAAKAKADDERLAAQRAANCRSARGVAASLENGTRVVRTNEKGEREVLDDRARADELRRARDAISSECR